MKYNNTRYTIYLPIIIVSSVIVGILLGRLLWIREGSSRYYHGSKGNKLDMAIEYIAKDFVDSISRDKLVEDAIPALLSKLDPHSQYIPASDFNEVNDPLTGNFEGIGVQFNLKSDTVIVMQVIAGGPSEKANLRAGDRIVKVNDSVIAGRKIATNDVVHKLKGPRGTKVKVGILRRGTKGLIDFVITRDKIPFYSIDASFMVDSKIGYVKISRFASTTHDEFVDKVRKLKAQGMKKLILDLRGNGGGVVTASTTIANEFLEAGKLILYTKGRAYPREDYVADEDGICKKDGLVILIDEGTASASEILSGAIQDNDRGIIIGRRSFGKGLVMDQQMFADGSALRLTISRYYTPTGRCIQKPYDGDHEKYYAEIENRFRHGEFEKQDSIKFPDSLKFRTKKGKIVYGGGGIMPDIFVPLDTTHASKYIAGVSNLGLIYDFAFNWVDNNRKDISKYKTGIALNEYLNSKNLVPQFTGFAESKGVKANQKDISRSLGDLKEQIQTMIVRDVLGEEAFYELWLKSDKTFQKAFEVSKKTM
jgi:carboxyl-terminal processing protease